MNQELKCKFCGVNRTVIIDDDYVAMRDPYGLFGLFSCNRCADYHTARIRVVSAIKKKCLPIIGCRLKPEMIEKYREWFTLMVKRYMRITADFLDTDMPDWDDEIVNQILAQPGNYGLVLQHVYQTFKQPTLI